MKRPAEVGGYHTGIDYFLDFICNWGRSMRVGITPVICFGLESEGGCRFKFEVDGVVGNLIDRVAAVFIASRPNEIVPQVNRLASLAVYESNLNRRGLRRTANCHECERNADE